MHTDIVNTEHSEHWLGLDDSDNTDKLAVMAAIVKKSPVFRLQKSGNPSPTYMPAVHQRHGRTDRRTDGRHYNSNTALALRASRVKSNYS